jgi:pimeloyl-ACP methyl ester carboxylesterase
MAEESLHREKGDGAGKPAQPGANPALTRIEPASNPPPTPVEPGSNPRPDGGQDAFDPYLLAPFAGALPPAPDWFHPTVNSPYQTLFIEVDGARVHVQVWGSPGPLADLLLVHGNGAHAHWWDFIAPGLAQGRRVVAMTFSGMGDSDWRASYSLESYSEEQMAVLRATGLLDGGRKPVIVAHSFGGFVTLLTGARHGSRLGGTVIVDTPIRMGPPPDREKAPVRRQRVYPDLTHALARFRLAPSQPCENLYLVDHIARHSLKCVTAEDGTTGWTWKFDPSVWRRFTAGHDMPSLLAGQVCPTAFIRGQESALVPDAMLENIRARLNPTSPVLSVPDARHHVMLDNPLTFLDILKSVLNP